MRLRPSTAPGTAVDGDRTPLETLIRQDRRVEQVTGLVNDLSRSLGFFSGPRDARVFCHRFRDRRVETAVLGLEFLGGDWRILFDGEFADGLTNVSIVVNDLRYGEPEGEQVAPVARRRGADRTLGMCRTH
jgi:hypothetical protein